MDEDPNYSLVSYTIKSTSGYQPTNEIEVSD